MYRAGEVSVHRACCERATQPYSLGGGGTIWPGSRPSHQVVTTRCPRIVTECLLTRSMLIKVYVYAIYSRFRIGTILSIRKHGYEFITTLSLSNLTTLFLDLRPLYNRLNSTKVHILSTETYNCPSWISGRERMAVEIISWSTKRYVTGLRFKLMDQQSGALRTALANAPPRTSENANSTFLLTETFGNLQFQDVLSKESLYCRTMA